MKSDFWIDYTGTESKTDRLLALQQSRKTIADFVHIVTGLNIPVTISGANSYTDGKSVTISSDLKPEEFDVTIGLALHEGSHIKLTDFELLPKLMMNAREIDANYEEKFNPLLKDILNVVEDRRIDNFIYKGSPGFRGYYQALYNKYFRSDEVDNAIATNLYNQETIEHYMFHVINIANNNRNLKALKGLQEIWDILDLNNISRLKTTKEALKVSIDILNIMLKYVPKDKQEYDPNKNSDDLMGQGDGEGGEGASTEGSGEGTPMTAEQAKALGEALAKQREFINDNFEKRELTSEEASQLDALGEAGVQVKSIGSNEVKPGTVGRSIIPKVSAILVNKITPALAKSGTINGLDNYPSYEDEVANGKRRGNKLAHYLRARQEERTLKTTRQKSGRIDKRLISQLGYGEYNVFSNVETSISNRVHIHISIDASGSMGGSKFKNSITTAVSIATAASKIQGMQCVIDFRHQTNSKQPCVIIGYDSRKQKISEINNIAYINCNALTPEGLCYETIMDVIEKSNSGLDSYLINFSDGSPSFTLVTEKGKFNYSGITAEAHTKQQIDKIKAKGVKVLSYFIDEGYSNTPSREFVNMYGQDSVMIDTNNIQQVAKTVNKLLMK